MEKKTNEPQVQKTEAGTVSALFEQYLSQSIFSDSTVETKRRSLMFFTEQFGDLETEKILYSHAMQYRKALAGRGAKARTINTYLRSFAPFFVWAVRAGFIQANPFSAVKSLPEDDFMLNPYTPRELDRMLRIADSTWRAMILLSACCSMRRSEILNLTAADIDFDEGKIWIQPKRDTKDTWLWEIKNHRRAVIGLPGVIRLPHIQVNLPALLVTLIESHPEQPYIFVKPAVYKKLIQQKAKEGGLPWRERNCPWGRNFDRDFKSLLKRSLVEHKRFHDLRGTCATMLIKNGFNIKEVQSVMRHSSPNTTAKYYLYVEERALQGKTVKVTEACYEKQDEEQ